MSRKSIFLMVWVLVVGVAAGSALAELIAYYPFEEGQGTETVDATGNGNDGALNSGVQWVAGYKGGAVHFDTAGERIVIGPIDPTAANNAMTLAAWINWEGRNHSIAQQGIIGKRLGWSTTGDTIKWFWQTNPAGDLLFRADYSGGGTSFGWGNALLVPYANEWVHVAATWDNGAGVQYINGEQVSTGNTTLRASANATPVTIGCVDSTNDETFVGTIDEVRIYDTVLTGIQLQQVMVGDYTSATSPVPPDGSTDIPQDVILSWSPGESAASHDVYFGTSLEDVAAAERGNPLGVLASQGQTGLTFDPPGLLDFSQTYYWRVDEVNGAPDFAIHKGGVWSFTVEPYVYPVTNIIATASLADADSPAQSTIDGSGLNADDRHSTEATDMWLASPTDATPIWIQYEFDQIYQLWEMEVWNYNSRFELVLGFGLKDVTIEHSIDGAEWTVFGDVEFAKATARSDYAANTILDLRQVAAKYIRITVKSNWNMGVMPQYGLSEVRFTYLPVQAREPVPAVGQADVALDVTLDWRSGRRAAAHELYVSTDQAAVVDGTALVDTLGESRYELGGLNFGSTYYWKVNEVNEAGAGFWEGDVWSFSTIEYAMVDDFEGYTDDIEAGQTIFQAWIDGWTNDTGSTVGYLDAPFAEKTIVHGGKQSMPLAYDNTASPFYSEAEREFDAAQDWTGNGADTLVLYVRGNAPDFVVAADGRIVMSAVGTDIWGTADQFRFAHKSLSGNGSIAVRVDSLVRSNEWAKAGVMIRETLEPGSKHAFVAVTPEASHGVSFQRRPIAGGDSANTDVADVDIPHWVKLTRTGNVFTAQRSADGVTWTDIPATAPVDIMMASNVYIGLAVTSHDAVAVTAAEFSNVSTSGSVTGNWQTADIGITQPVGNSAESMYLRIEDSAGKTKTVVNADASITQRPTWQEWAIPYSDLNGVNLSRVEKMTIGVGSATSPSAGGTGIVYVDDIARGSPAAP
jgi:hypothetical protein